MFKRRPYSMIRSLSYAAGLAYLLPLPLATATELAVTIDKTQILRLPAPASTVVVGNPSIADVSIHSENTLFIVGRGYGETNIIILDKNNEMIMDTNILVKNPRTGVRLFKVGKGKETYSCTPYCMQAPILGDIPSYVSKYSGKEQIIQSSPSTAAQLSNGAPLQGQTGYGALVNALAGTPPSPGNRSFGPPSGRERGPNNER